MAPTIGFDRLLRRVRGLVEEAAIIRAAAVELPRVDLGDALAVCVAIREAEPDRFEHAALRWLARSASSAAAQPSRDVTTAATAFEGMAERPADALDTLRQDEAPRKRPAIRVRAWPGFR